MHSTESEITKSRGKHISTSDLITLTVGCITILITILAVAVQISECLRKRKKVCPKAVTYICGGGGPIELRIPPRIDLKFLRLKQSFKSTEPNTLPKQELKNLRDEELRIVTRPQSALSTSSRPVSVHLATAAPQSSQRASRAVVYAHSIPSSSRSSQRSSRAAGCVHSRSVSSHSFQRASVAEHQMEPASPS